MKKTDEVCELASFCFVENNTGIQVCVENVTRTPVVRFSGKNRKDKGDKKVKRLFLRPFPVDDRSLERAVNFDSLDCRVGMVAPIERSDGLGVEVKIETAWDEIQSRVHTPHFVSRRDISTVDSSVGELYLFTLSWLFGFTSEFECANVFKGRLIMQVVSPILELVYFCVSILALYIFCFFVYFFALYLVFLCTLPIYVFGNIELPVVGFLFDFVDTYDLILKVVLAAVGLYGVAYWLFRVIEVILFLPSLPHCFRQCADVIRGDFPPPPRSRYFKSFFDGFLVRFSDSCFDFIESFLDVLDR
ncbi:MAG: hypothetical protein KatS3mg087_0470 [Patescibacteria group bacterium]|nr:MAG: hypothetical protein KatS3mg087_0470 [Patescibacteria group bacterium]